MFQKGGGGRLIKVYKGYYKNDSFQKTKHSFLIGELSEKGKRRITKPANQNNNLCRIWSF